MSSTAGKKVPVIPANATPHRVLSTGKVVFLVLAAIAPMTGVLSVTPLAFAFGGPATTASYIFVAIVLLCFAAGYAEMGKTMPSAGALYTYIRKGLGDVAASAGALLALLGYTAVLIGAAATSVYYFQYLASNALHIDIPWGWYLVALVIVVAALATRNIDINAKVVAILVVCELAVMLILDLAILASKGITALTPDVLTPSVISSGSPGVAVMYAFLSFLGFEAASLYAREAKNPHRTIPRALMISICVLGAFFVLCTWLAAGGVGASQIQTQATSEGGELYFNLASQFAGSYLHDAMSVVLVTSLFATTLGMTNFAARYLQSLSEERLAPRWFAAVEEGTGVPKRAALGQSLLVLIVVGGLGILGADPYIDTGAVTFGLGAASVVLLQTLAAIAILRYLRLPESRGEHQGGKVVRKFAPPLGFLGLIIGLVLVLNSLSTITGKTGAIFDLLPWIPFIVAAIGAGLGWLHKRRPLGGREESRTVTDKETLDQVP